MGVTKHPRSQRRITKFVVIAVLALGFAYIFALKVEMWIAHWGDREDHGRLDTWVASNEVALEDICRKVRQGQSPSIPDEWREDWPHLTSPVLDKSGNVCFVLLENRYGVWGIVRQFEIPSQVGDLGVHHRQCYSAAFHTEHWSEFKWETDDAYILPCPDFLEERVRWY